MQNPYSPTELGSDKENVFAEPVESQSVLLKNLIGLISVSSSFAVVCLVYRLMQWQIDEFPPIIAIVAAGTASAWANLPIGERYKWSGPSFLLFFLAVGFSVTLNTVAAAIAGTLVMHLE